MTRLTFVRPLAIVAAGAMALAACGSSAPSTGPTTPPLATVAPPTQAAPATGAPGFSFTLPSVDKELEAVLPDQIGGVAVQKASMTGEAMLGVPGSEEFQQVLAALNKTPADVTGAFGGTTRAITIAVRIKGLDAGTFFNAFVQASQDDQAVITDATIAGKPAKKVVDGSGATTYLYFTGDTVVTIAGAGADLTDPELTEIFGQLP
jgi:hypothetical protein